MNCRHPRLRSSTPHRREAGFTLLEVLVAVLVLAFGVLGMSGLQAASMQANKDARQQSSAVRLARELGEMMRGNKDVAIQTTAAANPYLVDFSGSLPTTTPDCFASPCTSTLQVAQSDLRNWLSRIQGTTTLPGELPNARVVVCFDATPYNATTGRPQWTCSNSGGTVVVKIGWTRHTTDHGAEGSTGAGTGSAGLDLASAPSIVMPVIAGSIE